MADNKSRVIFEPWDTYVRESDAGPFFISFDVEAARKDLTDTLTSCARVVIRIKDPGGSGGPERPESRRLWALEDDLCSALGREGVRCRLVGRLTHGGLRVLVFQLDDWAQFRPPLESWIVRCGDYQVRVVEGEGWEFFNDCIRPEPDDWRFMADVSVIQNLIKHGSNPDKEHALDFVFLGEPGNLRQIAEALQNHGFEPQSGADPDQGRVVMVKRMNLDVRGITSLSRGLARRAEEFGVNYDGWGAAIVR
jgi:regulator of RNase E activity RraB